MHTWFDECYIIFYRVPILVFYRVHYNIYNIAISQLIQDHDISNSVQFLH